MRQFCLLPPLLHQRKKNVKAGVFARISTAHLMTLRSADSFLLLLWTKIINCLLRLDNSIYQSTLEEARA